MKKSILLTMLISTLVLSGCANKAEIKSPDKPSGSAKIIAEEIEEEVLDMGGNCG